MHNNEVASTVKSLIPVSDHLENSKKWLQLQLVA